MQVTQDAIEWKRVEDRAWRWMARDKNGGVWLYKQKPSLGEESWKSHGTGFILPSDAGAHVTVGTVDWENSLRERPNHV